ncbi:UbiA family prenyltransferase [Burkholderia sp. Ac-20379]|uniref:UbiA family prenyltransferase n=1 Tax=Burkholderia sp. Ac-20379 TaxID=2703900 RepID=UPI00197DB7EF|nr:UbiA family prenyltransferase [Burkholderia sp. Ac-20379]MBN3726653.1 UbiA family prenyltransferase [Burkholderia sp. Ac-20379]
MQPSTLIEPAANDAHDAGATTSSTVIALRPDPALARTLVVDLEGALLRSGLLVESGCALLRATPHRAAEAVRPLLRGGKAGLTAWLAEQASLDVTVLPYDDAVLGWLRSQHEQGRTLVLTTSGHAGQAQRIADHLGIFDRVMASGTSNDKHGKRDRLVTEFGERGFDYIGRARADLAVWRSAYAAHLVNPSRGLERQAHRHGNVELVIRSRPPLLPAWIRALRFHQWLKNLLIFVPVFAAHKMSDPMLLLQALLAFLAFGMCASSAYLLNDLLDLQDDRHHPMKRKRPFASGALPIAHGALLAPLLLAAAAGIAWLALPARFAGVLGGYYVLTLAYSLYLKKQAMVDVVVLAGLYTARIVAGAAAVSVPLTFWLLGFSMFIFLSLALAKRYAELHSMQAHGAEKTRGRGYLASDLPLISSLGTSSGYLAVLVLALYIQDARTVELYRSPQTIWLACPLLLYWISRMWMVSHRGQMHHDPIVFAARDRVSLVVAVLFGAIFCAAW